MECESVKCGKFSEGTKRDFETIHRFCSTALREPTGSHLKELSIALAQLPDSVENCLMDYVLCPLLIALKNFKNQKEDVLIHLHECLRIIIHRWNIETFTKFLELYQGCIMSIVNGEDAGNISKNLSEEVFEIVIGNINLLLQKGLKRHMPKLFSEKCIPIVGHAICLLLQVVNEKTQKKIRLLAIRTCMRFVEEAKGEQVYCKKMMKLLPGLSMAFIKNSVVRSGNFQAEIVIESLRALTQTLLTLLQYEDESGLEKVDANLERGFNDITQGLLFHNNTKLRQVLADSSLSLTAQCSGKLPKCSILWWDNLLIFSNDTCLTNQTEIKCYLRSSVQCPQLKSLCSEEAIDHLLKRSLIQANLGLFPQCKKEIFKALTTLSLSLPTTTGIKTNTCTKSPSTNASSTNASSTNASSCTKSPSTNASSCTKSPSTNASTITKSQSTNAACTKSSSKNASSCTKASNGPTSEKPCTNGTSTKTPLTNGPTQSTNSSSSNAPCTKTQSANSSHVNPSSAITTSSNSSHVHSPSTNKSSSNPSSTKSSSTSSSSTKSSCANPACTNSSSSTPPPCTNSSSTTPQITKSSSTTPQSTKSSSSIAPPPKSTISSSIPPRTKSSNTPQSTKSSSSIPPPPPTTKITSSIPPPPHCPKLSPFPPPPFLFPLLTRLSEVRSAVARRVYDRSGIGPEGEGVIEGLKRVGQELIHWVEPRVLVGEWAKVIESLASLGSGERVVGALLCLCEGFEHYGEEERCEDDEYRMSRDLIFILIEVVLNLISSLTISYYYLKNFPPSPCPNNTNITSCRIPINSSELISISTLNYVLPNLFLTFPLFYKLAPDSLGLFLPYLIPFCGDGAEMRGVGEGALTTLTRLGEVRGEGIEKVLQAQLGPILSHYATLNETQNVKNGMLFLSSYLDFSQPEFCKCIEEILCRFSSSSAKFKSEELSASLLYSYIRGLYLNFCTETLREDDVENVGQDDSLSARLSAYSRPLYKEMTNETHPSDGSKTTSDAPKNASNRSSSDAPKNASNRLSSNSSKNASNRLSSEASKGTPNRLSSNALKNASNRLSFNAPKNSSSGASSGSTQKIAGRLSSDASRIASTDATKSASTDACSLSEENKEREAYLELAEKIGRSGVEYLSSGERGVRVIGLKTLTKVVYVLEKEKDLLLPLVHYLWEDLSTRFHGEGEDFIVLRHAFYLLEAVCETSKTFVSRRAMESVFPNLAQFLRNLRKMSSLGGGSGGGESESLLYKQGYKYQVAILKGLPKICHSLQISEETLDTLSDEILGYLKGDQHEDLAKLSRECLIELSNGPLGSVIVMKLIFHRIISPPPLPRLSEFKPISLRLLLHDGIGTSSSESSVNGRSKRKIKKITKVSLVRKKSHATAASLLTPS